MEIAAKTKNKSQLQKMYFKKKINLILDSFKQI